MPIYDRTQAKDSGFAQVREALVAFEGDVVGFEDGQWGQTQDDRDAGRKVKEFVEIKNVNVKILEVSEELTMIPTEWDFRVNTSMNNGSFWVDKFLLSADDNKVTLPNGLIGKRVVWRKVGMPFTIKGKNGAPDTDGVSSNFVIDKVLGGQAQPAPAVVRKEAIKTAPVTAPIATPPPMAAPVAVDWMGLALELAVGKTEAQFREAVAKDPQFSTSPLLPLAKAGGVTIALVNGKKLKLEGEVYQKV
jgi:hypothetical protein